MIKTFINNPLLLLFVVASLGFFIGKLKIRGSSLGVAAVLFTGLGFGAINPELKIPEIVYILGLVLFVYSIGLSSGPAFFKSYKKNGFRDFLFIMWMLIFSGLIAVSLFWLFGLTAATITGIYAGSTTNTPALAAVIDQITNTYDGKGDALINDAVMGYSLSYPMGVLGGIISILIMEKALKVDYRKEMKSLRKEYPLDTYLSSATVLVNNPKITGITVRDLTKQYKWDIIFARIICDNEVSLINWDTKFKTGDIIMVVGNDEDIQIAINDIGEPTSSDLTYDRSQFDVRRIFMSNSKLVGHLSLIHI